MLIPFWKRESYSSTRAFQDDKSVSPAGVALHTESNVICRSSNDQEKRPDAALPVPLVSATGGRVSLAFRHIRLVALNRVFRVLRFGGMAGGHYRVRVGEPR